MKLSSICALSFIAIAATSCGINASSQASEYTATEDGSLPFHIQEIANFNEPWAMTFIPNSRYALITEKGGKLMLWEDEGEVVEVSGTPDVDYGGQGGLGDIVLGPNYQEDNMVYLSWAEAGEKDTRGAVVGMAKLNLNTEKPTLEGLKVIWQQYPKVKGRGHYGHRIAFSPNGKYMFIASGERQKFNPSQDMDSNMGKVVRLYTDGSIPKDNPFYTQGNEIRSQIWSLGHRNPLGLTFDDNGQLWNQEMGPRHGDEINLVTPKANYGYPTVSNGNHYDGRDIPDHSDGDGFDAPKAFWDPAISPGGLMFYNGRLFPDWNGSLFLGGLGSRSLVRVKVNGQELEKKNQWDMNMRIREVEQGPDGAIWLLSDGEEGKLLRLSPHQQTPSAPK